MNDCPSTKTCQLLKCYLSCDYMNATGLNISMIFLPGSHLGQEMIKPLMKVVSLKLTGITNRAVTISSLKIVLLIHTILIIENITAIESSLSVSHHQESLTAFAMIINCKFLVSNVSLLLPHVHMNGSVFSRTRFLALSDSSATAIHNVLVMSIFQCTFIASDILVQTASVHVKDNNYINFVNSSQS